MPCWVPGDVEVDAALKLEGRNGIMRFCVPQLVCVEVMRVCTAELLSSSDPMLPLRLGAGPDTSMTSSSSSS